jgi:hypothetical protein
LEIGENLKTPLFLKINCGETKMELKVTSERFGLMPERFENIKTLFLIDSNKENDDCVIETKKKDFSQYELFLCGQNNGGYIGDFSVKFLFGRQLNALIKAYGGNTKLWAGKKVFVSSQKQKDSQYFNWILEPVVE